MKTKYLFFSVLFVFIVWGIVACKDDDGLDMPVELTIGGNQTTFEFPAMGGEQKLAMKSNYPWGAEMSPLEDSVWCKLKVSEKELVISPLQNLDTLVRSSRVKIFSGEGENMKTLYLDVVQKAGDKMSIMFSPEKVVFSPKEETREVMYMTFSPEIEYKWRGDTLVDWITVQLDAENSKLLLTSEFNELLTARRATLEVSGGVGGNRFTDTLAIEQMGNEPMIVANPDTVRIDAAGGSVDIEVLSTVEKYNVEASGWVKMELKEFELFLNGTIMKFGDIVIDKCTVKKETHASTFTGQQNLTFSGDAAALGTCATTVEGTVESGALTMNINVKVTTLQQTVKVTYSGVKQVEESGNN